MDSIAGVSNEFLGRLPIGIIVLDSEGNVRANNNLAFEMLGISVEELIIGNFEQVISNALLRKALLQMHRGGAGKQDLIISTLGREIKCTLNRQAGKEENITIVLEDATQFKRMDGIKHEFIETILHRVRNPLSTIKTSLAILNTEKVAQNPDKQRRIVDFSYRETNRLHALLNDLRDLFYVEIGLAEEELEIEEFEIDRALQGAMDDLRRLPTPFKYSEERLGIEGDLNCRVKADYEKMKQMLFDLLKNAIMFTPDEAAIGIRIIRQADLVNILVWDNGIGICNENVPLIFSKFFREDNAITRDIEGNGLGLYLAKSYAELMGGTIYCETEKGKGSTFTVSFPVS